MPILIKGSGGRKPKLQSKTITPSTYSRSYTPDSGYDGFGEITISARPAQTKPTGGNAAAADVREGKTFYSGGSYLTGTMKDITLPVPTYTTSFTNNNTQLKIVASYTPSVGYVGSTNKVAVTKTLNIPQSSAAQAACEYLTGSFSIGPYDPTDHQYTFGTIPSVDGKTLKYILITQSCNDVLDDGDIITSIYLDANARTADITYYRYGAIQNLSYSKHFSTVTSNNDVWFRTNDILTSGYGVFEKYDYLAVYQ